MKIRIKETDEVLEATDPLLAFLGYLQGKLEILGDRLTLGLIEAELKKMGREAMRVEIGEAMSPEQIREMRSAVMEKLKPALIRLVQEKRENIISYDEVRARLKDFGFTRISTDHTVTARLRDLANPKLQATPFLINLARGTGRYALNLDHPEVRASLKEEGMSVLRTPSS